VALGHLVLGSSTFISSIFLLLSLNSFKSHKAWAEASRSLRPY
jgi:hypothetical protein